MSGAFTRFVVEFRGFYSRISYSAGVLPWIAHSLPPLPLSKYAPARTRYARLLYAHFSRLLPFRTPHAVRLSVGSDCEVSGWVSSTQVTVGMLNLRWTYSWLLFCDFLLGLRRRSRWLGKTKTAKWLGKTHTKKEADLLKRRFYQSRIITYSNVELRETTWKKPKIVAGESVILNKAKVNF
jgi:hypothetical protein